MNKNKFLAKKRFGQNFLIDENIINEIISLLNIKENDYLLEIGPGHGALTKKIYKGQKFKNLNLVEIDKDLFLKLKTYFKDAKNVKIFQEDILNFDLKKIVNQNQKIRIIGNLPYNISTPLIFKLLNQIDLIEDMHFMLQKEVAYRLNAIPNNKNYGKLSVMIQYYCKVKNLIDVKNSAFQPQPKVQSAFVRLTPHKNFPIKAKNINSLKSILNLIFTNRRKTIYNALKRYLPIEEFSTLNINPKSRPETLSIYDFVKLSDHIENKYPNILNLIKS